MDRTEEIEYFRPHQVNRALVSTPRAGGKSFIVARALRRLGQDVTLYGFLGGPTGQYLRAECAKLGIRDRHTTIEGETRINTVLVDRHAGLATVINEPGPEISKTEAESLRRALDEHIEAGDILVLSGSLPRGIPLDTYAGLITSARQRGARAIVDAEGEVLVSAVSVGPWAVKCNLQEFRAIAPDAPEEVTTEAARQQLFDCMRVIVAAGVQLVIVTLGANGLLAVSRTEALEVSAPSVVAKNPTGSGDTFLAAFVAAYSNASSLEYALKFGAAAASANAAVLVPDIGPSPQLDTLVAGTTVIRHEPDFADSGVAGTDR
ncbi:fructose-1-phosphate kinase [Microterricola viridarii]|uniref:Fructose-1-phosphate kinase n=2 Tax=Microterricola viridarii TaxID=412690 RepID=A0A1H1T0Z5_9MICO|nr:fructose-1-phosphate kinase [Microterricola viridarii]